jgi:hypothetical protein
LARLVQRQIRRRGVPVVVQGLCAVITTLCAPPAAAEPEQADASPTALVAARELFREAAGDADAGRWEQAWGKFKRVSAVKETASVRYNIARCEEALSHLALALADYELAERESAGDAKATEIGSLAHDAANTLRPAVPRLTLIVDRPPPDLAVSVDGEKVSPATFGVALPIDPGRHMIEATAMGRRKFRKDVELHKAESERVAIVLPVEGEGERATATTPGEARSGSGQQTLGMIAVGGGVVLAGTAGAFVLLQRSAASSFTDLCPGGQCKASDASQGRSDKNRASLFGTLAWVTGGVAVAAVAVGVTLLLTVSRSKSPSATWIAPGGVAFVF